MNELPHVNISDEMVEMITNIPKGDKPNPSLYLRQTEIETHLSLFDEGVVRIQSRESFENAINQYGSNIGDPATGTFVSSKSVVERAIRVSEGNPRILEKLLGLDSGYLGDNPVLINVIEPHNIRVPSGNEAGAWPNYWIPGGYTSGGVPEAVIDQIKEGEYIVTDIYIE